MCTIKGETILYGIENINDKLDSIINELKLEKYIFEIKLIISEAITNAYIHGNKSDNKKPINVSWVVENNNLCVQVKDSGESKGKLLIGKSNDLLSESGRGLFIISAYTDEFYFENNTIIMKKSLT